MHTLKTQKKKKKVRGLEAAKLEVRVDPLTYIVCLG